MIMQGYSGAKWLAAVAARMLEAQQLAFWR
jgi:hypothetical protein